MKYFKSELIINGIIAILLAVGIVYTVYTVFQTKASNAQVVNFINSTIAAQQKAPTPAPATK